MRCSEAQKLAQKIEGWRAVGGALERSVEVALQAAPALGDDGWRGGILHERQRLERQGGQVAQREATGVEQRVHAKRRMERRGGALPLLLMQHASQPLVERGKVGEAPVGDVRLAVAQRHVQLPTRTERARHISRWRKAHNKQWTGERVATHARGLAERRLRVRVT
jgi:hypothetical protein